MGRGLRRCLVVSLACGVALGGCAGPSRAVARADAAPAGSASPSRVETVADWDDLPAAVGFALSRTELVRVSVLRPSEDRAEFRLRSSRDEPALLVATRRAEPGRADPVPIELTCAVGRFGDPARERRFLDLVVERLGQLRGVDVAPIRR